ncbi:LOW QUALITY PROTEIN: uncharacterized protein ACR2FA_002147 [Aphomia sociella]
MSCIRVKSESMFCENGRTWGRSTFSTSQELGPNLREPPILRLPQAPQARPVGGPRRLGPGWQMPPRLYGQSDAAYKKCTSGLDMLSTFYDILFYFGFDQADTQPPISPARNPWRRHFPRHGGGRALSYITSTLRRSAYNPTHAHTANIHQLPNHWCCQVFRARQSARTHRPGSAAPPSDTVTVPVTFELTTNMNSYVKIAVVLCACVALSTAQFGYNTFAEDYLTSFGSSNFNGLSSAAARDPRANTGPVVFPSPPGDPSQTSGVVVGASGYGFVPPGSQGKTYGR